MQNRGAAITYSALSQWRVGWPCRRCEGLSLHYFYGSPRIRFRNFMSAGFILVCTMNDIVFGIRGLCLTLLILAAIAHADLHASIAGSGPHISGLGRLGRDLVRRENGEGA